MTVGVGSEVAVAVALSGEALGNAVALGVAVIADVEVSGAVEEGVEGVAGVTVGVAEAIATSDWPVADGSAATALVAAAKLEGVGAASATSGATVIVAGVREVAATVGDG